MPLQQWKLDWNSLATNQDFKENVECYKYEISKSEITSKPFKDNSAEQIANSEGTKINKKEIKRISMDEKKKVTILRDILIVPKVTETSKKIKSKKRDPYMFVLTHSLYKKCQEEKAQEALEIEQRIEGSKRKREENRTNRW